MSCETRRLSYKVVVRLVGWDLPQSHRACTVHHIRALAPRYVRQLRAVLLPITFVHIQSLLSPPGEWRGLSTGPFLLSYSVFMAAESKAIIFCRCNLFFSFFVSTDKRSAMGSQPNLASRSEVVLIYKCPPKFRGGPPPNLEHKKSPFGPLFRDFRTRHRISPKRNVASTN